MMEEAYYDDDSRSVSEDEEEEREVATKRKVSKKKRKDLHENDPHDQRQIISLINNQKGMTHKRPAFMKRWDGESNYLEIMDEEFRSFSPSMAVYWRQKSQYMNAVIFVQFGALEHHVYQNDAILCHELFGKHVGTYSKFLVAKFFPNELTSCVNKLYKKGIAMRFMHEVDDPEYRKKYGIIKRVLKRVINPGVHIDYEPESTEPSQRFLLSLFPTRDKELIGVVVIDTSTSTCYIEQTTMDDIRRVLNKFKPVEIVIPFGDNKELKRMIKQICSPFLIELEYVKTTINDILSWTITSNGSPIFSEIKEAWKQYQKKIAFKEQNFIFYDCLMAVDLLSQYFKKMGVWDHIIPTSKFQSSCFLTLNIHPVFDSQVYENLEIFEVRNEPESFGKMGTLFAYLNKCSTKAGERKLRQWLNSPLTDVEKLRRRQEGVLEIMNYTTATNDIHSKLGEFPDFETKLASIYHWIVKNPENFTLNIERSKTYEQDKNPLLVKVKQMKSLLVNFQHVSNLLHKVKTTIKFKSPYMNQLLGGCSIKPAGKKGQGQQPSFLQKLNSAISNLLDNFIDGQDGTVHPRQGLVPDYDTDRREIAKMNEQLDTFLEQYKTKLDIKKMKYASVRARNEIQISKDEQIKKADSKWFRFSSMTMKVNRYITQQTQELSELIMERQTTMDEAIAPFLNQVIKEFASYKFLWTELFNIISQLDVMLTLAKVSNTMEIRCVPQFVEFGLEYENGIHVGLAQMSTNVVRNSLKFEGSQSTMLITGPNMGGKSTFLRQTCILAIIAQIGCLVPTQSYKAHPFDQIFCRIGASDRLHEGKSTFYVEMEETKHILEKATKNSLVIIDELGRGTSTFDGISIAVGVLRDLAQNIGCITLFSTHHSLIADQFQLSEKVRNKTVDYSIQNGKLVFKYSLKDGVVEKSFALNVAKMVGIPQSILKRAEEKSVMITNENNSLKQMQIVTKKFNDFMLAMKRCEESKEVK